MGGYGYDHTASLTLNARAAMVTEWPAYFADTKLPLMLLAYSGVKLGRMASR
jgi:hypothetical protein